MNSAPFEYKNPDGLMFIDPRTNQWMPFFDEAQIAVLEKGLNNGSNIKYIAYPFIPAQKMQFLENWLNPANARITWHVDNSFYIWMCGQLDLPQSILECILWFGTLNINLLDYVDEIETLSDDVMIKLIRLYRFNGYRGRKPFRIVNDKSLTNEQKAKKLERMCKWREFWDLKLPGYAEKTVK